MLKNKKNNLDNRREFYIYRVIRDGKMYDDNETERKTITKNQKETDSSSKSIHKKTISYAESVGYREDPKRYDNLRPKKSEDKPELKENQIVDFVEPPREDKTIGYYDAGVIFENEDNIEENDNKIEDNFDDIALQVDEIYQENFDDNNEEMQYDSHMYDDVVEEEQTYKNVNKPQFYKESGHVTVVGTAGTIIEEGTVFCTEGTTDVESVEFATTEEATIPEQGTVDIPVASVLTGASYNVTRNTVTLQKQPNKNVTSVTNENPIRGGTDEEDDDTYRERILEKLRSAEVSFVGCDADYVRWAKEVSGVGSAVVEAEWKGPGTVKVVVADPDGSAVGEDTLKAVEDYIVSPKDRMKRLAPIGASVTISTVKDMTVSYSAVLELESNYSIDNVKEAFLTALKTYYREAKDSEEIRYTVASALLSNTAGVIDFSDFRINENTNNISVAADYYPITTATELNFTEG